MSIDNSAYKYYLTTDGAYITIGFVDEDGNAILNKSFKIFVKKTATDNSSLEEINFPDHLSLLLAKVLAAEFIQIYGNLNQEKVVKINLFNAQRKKLDRLLSGYMFEMEGPKRLDIDRI